MGAGQWEPHWWTPRQRPHWLPATSMATASASPHLASNGCLSTDNCVALPSFEACGQCFELNCGKHSGKQEPRGDPGCGRPSRCVTKQATTFVMARYCPSLLRFLLTDAFQPDAVPQVGLCPFMFLAFMCCGAEPSSAPLYF
jgi:hypothetical protein